MTSPPPKKGRHPRAGGDPCDHHFVLSSKSGSIMRRCFITFEHIQNAETPVDPRLRGDDGVWGIFKADTQLNLNAVRGV